MEKVVVHRYRCTECGRTFRHWPEGVSQAQQSDRVKYLAAVRWSLGLSLRAVTAVLGVVRVRLCHQTVWEDAVALADQLRRRWRGRVRVLGPGTG